MTVQITKANTAVWIAITNTALTRQTMITLTWRYIKFERLTRHPRTDRVRWLAKGEAA